MKCCCLSDFLLLSIFCFSSCLRDGNLSPSYCFGPVGTGCGAFHLFAQLGGKLSFLPSPIFVLLYLEYTFILIY